MSGLEVIGGISAVIGIVDGLAKAWAAVRKDFKFSDTFTMVCDQLPILLQILQICHQHLEPVEDSIPDKEAQALYRVVQRCRIQAEKLETIFRKTIPGEKDKWYERYQTVARRLGQGSRVEELVEAITKDSQMLVNYHVVKSVQPDLGVRLEQVVEQIRDLPPSLPSKLEEGDQFSAGRDLNVNKGSGTVNVMSGHGIAEYSGSGNPTLNFGPRLPTFEKFSGVYAHAGLNPVNNYVPRPELERQLYMQLEYTGNAHQHENPKGSRTAVLWGLGGAGKSQLVLRYAQKHSQSQHYRHIFWVAAGQKQTVERDYLAIYRLLFPQVHYSLVTISIADAVNAVKSWLQDQEGRMLWVMDSADTVEDKEDPGYIDLQHYLPDAPRLDRIITTRSALVQDLSSADDGIEVREMQEEEAIVLFRRCAKLRKFAQEVNEAIAAIVQELGYLALAITLAGAYVKETPRLISDVRLYLPEYRAHRKRLLSRTPQATVHRYSTSVLNAWEMSLAGVARQSPIAAGLLSLLAFLHFDDIFLNLVLPIMNCTEHSDLLGRLRHTPWMSLLTPDGVTLDRYIIERGFYILREYSLLSWRPEQEAYSMHKLVHAWSYDRLEDERRREWSLAALDLLNVVIHNYEDDLSTATRLLPHIIANFTAVSVVCGSTYRMVDRDRMHVDTIGILLHRLGRWNDEHSIRVYLLQMTQLVLGREHPSTMTSMNNLAIVLNEQGKYEEAEKMFRETLELMKTTLGPEHPETLTSRNNLAIVLNGQGKHQEAEKMLRETLELTGKTLGPEHSLTLMSISNLATVLNEQGKYEEAEKMHRETLELRKKALGPVHPSTLTSMNNLAAVLRQQGRHQMAEKMHRETLELMKTTLGPEHTETLKSMNNLAAVLSEQCKHQEAEKMLRETLELMGKSLGPEHPSTLTSMNNLATVLNEQGKYGEAEKMYRETLELMGKSLGPEHPLILQSMHNVAEVLKQQGKYEEAEKMFRETLELRQKALGPEHPETLVSMNNLAIVLCEQGKHQEAEKMHRETLELMKTALGPEHPVVLTSMNNLATVLNEQGKDEEAEKMHRETLELRKKALGPEHTETLISMNNLAMVLSKQGKHQEAEKMLRETLELMGKSLGPEHPSTLTSMNNLATVLNEQGKDQEAEKMLRETLELMKTALGPEHPSILTSMSKLAIVLSEQGKYEEAEKMLRETLELRQKALGPEHPETLTSINNLAMVLCEQGKHQQAEKIFRETLELTKTTLGPKHPLILTSMNNLAMVLNGQGKHQEAEKMLRETLELMKTALGPEHPETLASMNNLAIVLHEQDK